jgi:hypothetical protein
MIAREFGIQTISIQRLDIFRQPRLKTLPAGVSYLSSNISTSEKFLISMAHLLDPKGSVLTTPHGLNLSICNVHVNIGNISNAEMRVRSSYMEKLTPRSGR